jgi:hypothetical protein
MKRCLVGIAITSRIERGCRRRGGTAGQNPFNMSTWKRKALEYLQGLKERILIAEDLQSLWREVEREFHASVKREDKACAGGCLKYAAWILHPTPQARTVADVSEIAARFFYHQADQLHHYMDRHDFMLAQKALKFHLGEERYSEFEARFLEKTFGYPIRPSVR